MNDIDYDKLAEAIQAEIDWQMEEWRKERLEEVYGLERRTGIRGI